MGLKDDLIDTAEDIGRELAVNGLEAFGKWVAKKIFGDAATDSHAEAIGRAALEAGVELAKSRAWFEAGGKEILERQMRDIAADAALVMDAFTPKGTIPPLGVVEEVTAEEIERRRAAGEFDTSDESEDGS